MRACSAADTTVVVTNATRNTVLASRARLARGLGQRLAGLLTRRKFPDGEGLIFPRCGAIHTCCMRFAIDVVFVRRVDSSGSGTPAQVVVKLVPHLRPFQFSWAAGADTVIELPTGTIARTHTAPGDHLHWPC